VGGSQGFRLTGAGWVRRSAGGVTTIGLSSFRFWLALDRSTRRSAFLDLGAGRAAIGLEAAWAADGSSRRAAADSAAGATRGTTPVPAVDSVTLPAVVGSSWNDGSATGAIDSVAPSAVVGSSWSGGSAAVSVTADGGSAGAFAPTTGGSDGLGLDGVAGETLIAGAAGDSGMTVPFETEIPEGALTAAGGTTTGCSC